MINCNKTYIAQWAKGEIVLKEDAQTPDKIIANEGALLD